ncbi:hypothetical protein [Streptomyces sp. NPDC088794]|uniref:hypothetical protein n=1 Tax=Streptomyces sp. NPDC088794 TaxID=3365902 RepID=UPI00381794FE
MATTDLIGTPEPADHPTAPLPQLAATALARLELSLLPPHAADAVSRYEAATARYDALVSRPLETLSQPELDSFLDAQQVMADAFGVLAGLKRLDLIGPAETAARYRQASAHCAELAARGDMDGCWDVQDEMRMCLCRLQAAGRLDLVGGA